MYRYPITDRQEFFMKRLMSTFMEASEDKYYEKNRTYWNTIGKNFLYNISTGVGCDTGLISEKASQTGNITDEHVYSNVKMFNRLFELYKEGKVDLEYLKQNVQHIVPTIKTTPEENQLLKKATKDMTIDQIRNMEHYKKCVSGLKWNPSSTKKYGNVTEAMKKLLITTNNIFF